MKKKLIFAFILVLLLAVSCTSEPVMEFTVSLYDGDVLLLEQKVKEGSEFFFPNIPKDEFILDTILLCQDLNTILAMLS